MFKKLFLFTALTTLVSAQQQQVSLRILAFPQQNSPEPVELLIGEGKTIKVDTPGNELSRAYRIPPLTSINVGKTVIDKEGKPTFQTYGQAKSIAAPEQIILLLRKGQQNSDGFTVLPIGADLKDFGGASFLFINASNLRIGGVIGDQRLDISPGQLKTLTPKPNFDGGICQVTLSYLLEDKVKIFFDTRWPANKKVRSLVIFYQDPETGRIGLAPIMDIISGPPTTETPP
jgi:hypothetical protein